LIGSALGLAYPDADRNNLAHNAFVIEDCFQIGLGELIYH